MFGKASRVELEESMGYERWVLSNVIEVMRRHLGKIDSIQYIIDYNDNVTVHISMTDEYGLANSIDLIHDLSGLLFSAAFKVLDMIVEWIIRENTGSCPWCQRRIIFDPLSR